MHVFAIADPHLSRATPKPMDIFGAHWEGHPAVFFERWREVVTPEDLVLIPGDISWAMKLDDALLDLHDLAALPGRKVLLRGNHDYWWPSISRLRAALPPGMYALQNDALKFGSVVVAGTRGWLCPGSSEFGPEDERIYQRELQRLKLSLQAAHKLGGESLIVMLHFPPTNLRLEPSGFTELLLEHCPDHLLFGHLHGDDGRRVIQALGHIAVHFVAADALSFTPKRIM
ncbi:MAG: metallophosphoesterase [Truepera sp.]|nr:metallophosphoesterase [Truepera sp.]